VCVNYIFYKFVWFLNIHTRNTSSYSAATVAAESEQGCWGCGGQGWHDYAEGNIDPLSDLFFVILGKNAIVVLEYFPVKSQLIWEKTNLISFFLIYQIIRIKSFYDSYILL